MTLKDAIKILIYHTGQDVCALSLTMGNESRRKKAKEAVREAWKYAYGFEPNDQDFWNIGF